MEHLIQVEIYKALSEGDVTKFLAYAAIFIFIWIEVRGLKKEVANLSLTITKTFGEAEHRFKEIEYRQIKFENELKELIQKYKGG